MARDLAHRWERADTTKGGEGDEGPHAAVPVLVNTGLYEVSGGAFGTIYVPRLSSTECNGRHSPGDRTESAIVAVDLKTRSPFATTQRRFDRAADLTGLSDSVRRILREVQRELTVHFPVRKDDGSVGIYTGYRVQDNINRGPASPKLSS